MNRIIKVFGDNPQVAELFEELEQLERKIFKLQTYAKNKDELLSWFCDGWEDSYQQFKITKKTIAGYFEDYIEDINQCIYHDTFEDLLDRKRGLLETIFNLEQGRLKNNKTKKIKNKERNTL